ncbi:MAG: hypothetical protein QM605_10465 [Sphingobium sp.]
MRIDAATLLARLGRDGMPYREFGDAFADVELWPIFEALLKDERVMGPPRSKLATRELGKEARNWASDQKQAFDNGGMFKTYSPVPDRKEGEADIRQFLSDLTKRADDGRP